jgi:hypothetical protein
LDFFVCIFYNFFFFVFFLFFLCFVCFCPFFSLFLLSLSFFLLLSFSCYDPNIRGYPLILVMYASTAMAKHPPSQVRRMWRGEGTPGALACPPFMLPNQERRYPPSLESLAMLLFMSPPDTVPTKTNKRLFCRRVFPCVCQSLCYERDDRLDKVLNKGSSLPKTFLSNNAPWIRATASWPRFAARSGGSPADS